MGADKSSGKRKEAGHCGVTNCACVLIQELIHANSCAGSSADRPLLEVFKRQVALEAVG